MSVTRRAVFEELAALTDAERAETTTVGALAAALDADDRVVEAHVDGLVGCDLARRDPDGCVRVTVTGEQLLALGIDGPVVVDPRSSRTG